ncbi:hypothetical protein SEA_SMOOCH_28 [Mycobacterium phage Smooch]|uniref:Uncharacterized protein n=2 Tax=Mycobacterium phage Corndog TaxID=205875 RepID=A0A5P8DDR5_BPMCO|nr:hypothetical protein PBI_YUNGJAMAL_27 [Mycobacterium phage YungJamal]QFP96519.1 hypothetical protein SEA_SMOOCH_28 [Mycobacterium phage Smooch]WUT94673.1 hypothetical protein SUAREZ_25 [Mycobacterium phage Suarez]
MANKKIADLIANGLRQGLVHPGKDGGPPTPVVIPMFRTEGMPNEMAELVGATADLLGEAIVELIETEGDSQIVSNTEVIANRVANDDDAARRQVTVHCQCDVRRTNPLAVLTVTRSPYVVVDGKQLIDGLAKRTAECPHGWKAS